MIKIHIHSSYTCFSVVIPFVFDDIKNTCDGINRFTSKNWTNIALDRDLWRENGEAYALLRDARLVDNKT